MKSKRKTPDIRFRGFTDDWEQRKLGELTGKISDGDWIESNHIVEDGDFRIIQTGNIGLGEFLNKENNSKFINFNSFNELKANEIFKDDILISRLADPAGRTIILPELKGRFVTAVDVAIVKPSEDFDSYFLMTSLNTVLSLNEVSKFVSGTSHKRISRKNLEKVTINVTNIYEQVLIGNLFSNIDNTITLHQRKLQQLKEVKRGMLLKMYGQQSFHLSVKMLKDLPTITFNHGKCLSEVRQIHWQIIYR